jgi:hypothetical protein
VHQAISQRRWQVSTCTNLSLHIAHLPVSNTHQTFPSLFGLYKDGYLPPETKIVGYARSKIEPDEYLEKITSGIEVDDNAKDVRISMASLKMCIGVKIVFDMISVFI